MESRWLLHHISWLIIVLWMPKHFDAASESTHLKAAHKFHDQSGYFKDGSFPQITQSPVDKTIKEGKGVALLCSAIGKPKPRIKWKKNGVTVTQDDRIKIRTTNGASKLRIKNAVGEDSGIYHCVAKNWLGGSKSIEATLVVREKNETRKRGTCKSYTGNVCSAFLAKDTRVFVPLLRSEKLAEERILDALAHLRGYIHPSCQKVLIKALCFNLFPPCRSVKPPRFELLCKDECEVLHGRTCSKEFRLLRKRLATAADDTLPNCLGLSYDDPERRHAHCLELGLAGDPAPPGRNKCSGSADVFPHIMEPLGRSHSLCDGTTGKKGKIYNKEIFHLLRNVRKEIYSGRMSLTVHSSELATYCFTAAIPLTNLVRDWNEFHQAQRIPNIQWPRNLTVPGLRITTVNSSVDSILVPIGSASCYRAHAKITLRDVVFYYRYDARSKRGSFFATGNYNLCETILNLTMETLSNGTFKLSGSSHAPLDLSTIETTFLTARPSEMIVKVIKDTNLFVARLMNPRMEAYIGKELLVKFSGESYFGANASPVSLEFYGGNIHESDILLVGISSRHFSMNQALNMFTEMDLPFLNFTKYSSSESSVRVTLSTTSLDLTRYPAHRFQQQPLAMAFADSVPKGLSLSSRSAIPTKCKGNHVCELLQVMFGSGSEFTIKVSIDWNEIHLGWHFHNFSKAAVSPFDRAEMTIKIYDWTLNGRVYRSGEQFKGLQFSGNLAYDGHKPNITARFATRIVLTRVFGMELFTLKNLQLGLSLSMNQSEQSTIQGKADLELGSGCLALDTPVKPKCLTGHVNLGFSDATADHYFYGTLSPVSLARLLEVCGVSHKLPPALASVGFPDGLQISVAREAHDLRQLGGPNLRPGFILTGKMSVLGIETSVAITLLPKDFLIDAEILSDKATGKIDDLASLSGSEKEHGHQLYVQARVLPEPFVKAHMSGYARLFGIFDQMRLLITREALQLHLMTDKRKSFQINVHIETNNSSLRNDTHVAASIAFENGLSKLSRLASKQVVQMLEAKMAELKSAKGDVQRRRKACNKTVKRECSNCVHNKSCAEFLERCRSERELSPLADVCHLLVLDRCLPTEGACRNACALIGSKANETCASYEVAAKSQRELEQGIRQAEHFMYKDLFHVHAISFTADITSESLDVIHLDTSLEVTIFGQKQRLDGLRMKFSEFISLSSEIAKYALEWYRNERPQDTTKERHADNMPRSSSPS